MTRKDFEVVAIALNDCKPPLDELGTDYRVRFQLWADVVVTMSNAFEAEYPAFDRSLFQYRAAGGKRGVAS